MLESGRLDQEPLVTSLVFADYEEMETAVALTTDMHYCRRGKGKFEGRLLRAHLGDIVLQTGYSSVAQLSYASIDPTVHGLLASLGGASQSCANGFAHSDHGVALYRPGGEHFAHTTGALQWVYVSLPEQAWTRFATTLSGEQRPATSQNCHFFEPPPEVFARLQRVLRGALQVLQDEAEILARPGAAEGMQHTLLDAFGCVISAAGPTADDGPHPRISQARVVSKVREFLADNLHATIYIENLCAVTGVSERTLRNAFRTTYGVGPNSYLKLRRLNQVQRLLKNGDAQRLTVTEAATQAGFWDMSRFAVEYKALFGETPSQTLRKTGR